jgi:precorrin-2 dehydrogenase/sirohydrochlorin ferrochelatase
MDAFPAFFSLAGGRVVIAGSGEPAAARARLLRGSPAEVVRLEGEAALDPAAYAGARLVFIASHDDAFARRAAAAARQSGAPVNVFDRPALSDFHTPAIVDRGAVVIAFGTAGAAPLVAQMLRADAEARTPEATGRVAALLGERRGAIKAAFPDLVQRRSFVRAILSGPAATAAEAGDVAAAGARLDEAIAAGWAAVGRVDHIDLPPADDLITLRAARAIAAADVLAADARADGLIASHARRDAERLSLAEADEGALADLVRAGKIVAVIGRPAP